MEELSKKLTVIQQNIVRAAGKAGRDPRDVNLLAVTKTVGIDIARQAYDLGIRDFGENRTQELNRKQAALPQARWHMIGRLQSNKVKDIVGKVHLIHSLDSWHMAEEINKRALNMQTEASVLLQVNISGETQKAGVEPDEVADILASLGQLPALRLYGFMTMAPLSSVGEESRPIFTELKNLQQTFQHRSFVNVDLKYLSMGMSQDYEVAVEEGAHFVRIGSALFH
ncbi:MAG TPA: YggS family pyridoxal phosphate-dependent enzyme [Syntrophomonas sp.]|jgi:pyridoxal phosphate enzyme (YggS family)|nr:YggS family pyridoxal phosphate-dependent enzyme [Syntrophomonas sp.]HRW13217.1 YggS family pyridoxal phosphate-dependent enzyme [Syntrophomonas sp.]